MPALPTLPNARSHLIALALLSASAGVAAAGGFPAIVTSNTTSGTDNRFVGAPDDLYWGLANGAVTFDFGDWHVVNRDGAVDLNVYEFDTSIAEFQLMTLLVSQDGLNFIDIKASQVPVVDIPGDAAHGNTSFARSYDLGALPWVRYVRVPGLSNVAPGMNAGFDLDAIGAHELVSAVPEPGGWALLLGGLGVVTSLARRRRP